MPTATYSTSVNVDSVAEGRKAAQDRYDSALAAAETALKDGETPAKDGDSAAKDGGAVDTAAAEDGGAVDTAAAKDGGAVEGGGDVEMKIQEA
jgi:hypothetical protein